MAETPIYGGSGGSIASVAEIDAGVDDVKAISSEGLAGSYAGTKEVQFEFGGAIGDVTNVATGDSQKKFRVPASMDGMNLVGVHAEVETAGITGTMDIQIRNATQATDMLTTKLTIDSTESGSDTAATPAVIDAANDDVVENDIIYIDVDAIQTTPAKAPVTVTLTFRLP